MLSAHSLEVLFIVGLPHHDLFFCHVLELRLWSQVKVDIFIRRILLGSVISTSVGAIVARLGFLSWTLGARLGSADIRINMRRTRG